MRNRFPGKCYHCLTHVSANYGTLRKRGGKWLIYCAACAEKNPDNTTSDKDDDDMRVSSLTVAEAYDACANAYGHRHYAEYERKPVTSDNRTHVRKWLVARGLPGAFVRTLPLSDLSAAWFDGPHPAPIDGHFKLLCERAINKGFTFKVTEDPQTKVDTSEADFPEEPKLPDSVDTEEPKVTFTVTKHVAPDEDYTPDNTPTEENTDMPIQNDDVAAAAAALAEALSKRKGESANVDPEMVRKIAQEEIEAAKLPRRVDVVINDVKKGELPELRHNKVELLMKIIAQKVYAFVVGGAGSGKTTMGEQIASALDLTLYIQGAMSGDHQLIGWKDAAGNYHTTPFRECFEKGGLIILDEFDGCTDPSVPLVVNAALANGYMTFPDSPLPIKRHEDFRCIVCANTFGTGADRSYNGRTQLDAATLDRFFYVVADYDEELEAMLPGVNKDWLRRVLAVRHAVAKLSMRHVISPRATLMGSKLLAAGLTQFEVEAGLLWKGLSDADRTKIENAIDK